MDTLIDVEQIKALRKQRLWSQEQLATVSGLSLRTVQRIETSGHCSLESKRSLAAAFEVDATDLDPDYERLAQQTGNAREARFGIIGAIVGMAGAYAGITWGFVSGDMSADVAGISSGIVGAVGGATCAIIGIASHLRGRKLTG